MQLTKLRAAPVRRAEVPPCAPAGGSDGGTASQLIRSVRPTVGSSARGSRPGRGHGAPCDSSGRSGCVAPGCILTFSGSVCHSSVAVLPLGDRLVPRPTGPVRAFGCSSSRVWMLVDGYADRGAPQQRPAQLLKWRAVPRPPG